jgi:predicted transcriptional regulator
MLEDKDILMKLLEALGLKSINAFSKKIGYSSPSALYLILSGERQITEHLIRQVKTKYPQINESFLRGKSEEVFEKEIVIEDIENYTLNDLPKIMFMVLEEQKKTNQLLVQLMNN